ncbi:MAG: 16S rRNA (guanine(527)-N(7))-methyltransferase RsmG [Novosphingobium sp.]
MIETEDQARAWLRDLPEVDAAAMDRLEGIAALLTEENRRQNLVSAGSLAQVWQRHIVDSAQLLAHVPRGTSPWLDLGTGAGFPGIVIAALRPDCAVTMVESRTKRIDWLERLIEALDLPKARVAGSRLELVESFPVRAISARAFAPLPQLLALSARFSTKDTIWLLPKGRSAAQELAELSGWSHMFHVEQSLTDPEAGLIVGTVTGQATPRNKGKGR